DADNLDIDESNDSFEDVFVRDLKADTTTLASRATGGAGTGGDADSSWPSISADGGPVAFPSGADNLDLDVNPAVSNVFVRNLQADTTTLASRATGATGGVGDNGSNRPSRAHR